MNAKQLTNILVKIVGLDLCAHAVPQLVVMAWVQFGDVFRGGAFPSSPFNLLTATMATPVISIVIGVFMIISSRVVTNWLFENEPQEP